MSTQDQPTPGPWWLDDEGYIAAGSGESYVTIAEPIGVDMPATQSEANARLIAAAPELLLAAKCALADLEGILPEIEPSGDRTHPARQTIQELSQAIAKATNG
jgi:hypothetical protein